MRSQLKNISTTAIVVTCSAIFGFWFLTPSVVFPWSTDWLRWGDMEFAQYIWQYYRHTPLLQWPVTAVDSYGEGWGTIFPSSAGIALVGLPLKFISPILPENFQFLGAWTLSCFVLQGFFADRLFAHFGLSALERIFGSLSILVAPIFIFRMGMSHLDLSAQWVVLAGLLLYFKDSVRRPLIRWLILIAVTISIHIYLVVLVIAIGAAWVVKSWVSRSGQNQIRSSAYSAVLMIFTSLLMWWFLGYATFLGQAKGVGFFRLNTLAFFNPESGVDVTYSHVCSWLPVIRNRAFFGEESEGFGFLGIVGILGLLVFAANSRRWFTVQRLRSVGPLFVSAVTLMLVAVSQRVAFARREFELPVPAFVSEARQVFRVANRFSWLAYYLVLIAGWISITLILRRVKFSGFIMCGLLVLGVWDQGNGMLAVRQKIIDAPQKTIDVGTADWNELAESVSRLYLVPTFDVQDDRLPQGAEVWEQNALWRRLVEFSSRHQITTNFAYVGRPVTRQVARSNEEIRKSIADRQVPPRSVLVFADPNEWRSATTRLAGQAVAKEMDGLYFLITKDDQG